MSIMVAALGFLVILLDGFDNYTLSYAAPYILRNFGITHKAVLGPVFSATLVGTIIGSMSGGYLADKIGRRSIILICCGLIGVPTILVVLITSIQELLALRFIVGIGVGGVAPCLISLATEYAPPRYRATMITVMYAGITVGAAGAGAAGTWLMPSAGWRSMFLIGGISALFTGLLCLLFLPESPSFLLAKDMAKESIRKHAKPNVVPEVAEYGGDGNTKLFLTRIFEGRLALVTPLLWIINFCVVMSFIAISSWIPTLLITVNRSPSKAASFGMIFLLSGTLGGMLLSWLIDKGYIIGLACAFAISVPSVLIISLTEQNDIILYILVFVAGFSIVSIQFALNAVCSLVYPARIRSSALGIFLVLGRCGGIIGPLLISVGLDAGIAPVHTLAYACFPLTVGCAASIWLAKAWSSTS